MNTVDEAVNVAKDWLSSEHSVPRDSIKTVSASKSGDFWYVVLSYYAFTDQRKFSITLSDDGKVLNFRDLSAVQGTRGFGSAPTMVLIAEIFSGIILAIWVISLIATVISAAFVPGIAMIATLIIYPFIFAIFFGVSVYVFLNIIKIKDAIDRGDAAEAFNRDSVGFGVVALLFNGLIPGILLLLAREDLRQAGGAPS